MSSPRESDFAEVLVDRLFLESFSNEQSAYHSALESRITPRKRSNLVKKLNWHIRNSLSTRQREVIRHYLKGKKEREIAAILGVTQQVVNIYKRRAIKKLSRILVG